MSAPAPGRQTGSFGDELTSAAMIGLIGVFALALLLRGAGSVAAFLTGTAQRRLASLPGSACCSPRRPATISRAPRPGHVDLRTVSRSSCSRCWRRRSPGAGRCCAASRARVRPTRTGWSAPPRKLRRRAGRVDQGLLGRATNLRPSLADPLPPADVGYRLGTSHGHDVWASVEDSILLIGPPRSSEVCTSSSPRSWTHRRGRGDLNPTGQPHRSLRAEQRIGPTAVFDPQHLAEGIPAGLRWSPIRGCEATSDDSRNRPRLSDRPEYGRRRGRRVLGGQDALRPPSPAARGRDRPQAARRTVPWTLDPTAAADAVAILTNNPLAADGWAESLEAMIIRPTRTRDSIWQGVSLSLSALADPQRARCGHARRGRGFRSREIHLLARHALYLLATGAGAGASAALVAAFVEDLVEAARRVAARSPGARLDPPMALILDEIAEASVRCRACRPSWPRAAAQASRPCRCSRASRRRVTRWARTSSTPSGMRRSARSSSAAHQQPRSARPLHADRRTRRVHRQRDPERPRHPLQSTLDQARADHAARPHPHPPVRHSRHHAALGPADHHRPARLAETTRRHPAQS